MALIKRIALSCLPVVLLFTAACAHVGTPAGGPKDETPPKLIRTTPKELQTNFQQNKIQLFFDELIVLNGGQQKVIISPPQIIPPQIRAVRDKIVIELSDTLKESTTYTIDFTDAIVDYNEKNPFGDYAFSFSTGNVIDSLRISGYLIDASNLNPKSGVLVGVYQELEDSIFYTKPMARISRTNSLGYFSIKGLPEKTFRLFALSDNDRDYTYDVHLESIAFMDEVITPWVEECIVRDTVWRDSTSIDSVYQYTKPCYKPDDVVLKYFTEAFGRQFLSKRERPSREQISLVFNSPATELPTIRLLNKPVQDWFLVEKNPTNDSIRYWITDSLVIRMDTLVLQVDYLKTDSTNQLHMQTDTLKLVSRPVRTTPPATERRGRETKKEEEPQVRHLRVQIGISRLVDMNQEPLITTETPLAEWPAEALTLYRQVDSTWIKVPINLSADSISLCRFKLSARWEYGTTYKLSLDSGAVKSIYGFTNNAQAIEFRVPKEEDYSQLILTVEGLEGHGFVELLDANDKVVRREKLVQNKVDFNYLHPGTYYARAIVDANGNGKWDTGDYLMKRQPETVYYSPTPFKLRPFWSMEETWNVNVVPVLNQKPNDLLPKEYNQSH